MADSIQESIDEIEKQFKKNQQKAKSKAEEGPEKVIKPAWIPPKKPQKVGGICEIILKDCNLVPWSIGREGEIYTAQKYSNGLFIIINPPVDIELAVCEGLCVFDFNVLIV